MRYNDLENGLQITKREADILRAISKVGWVKVQDIARAVSLPRTTVASVLGRLLDYGYIEKIRSEGQNLYTLTDEDVIMARKTSELSLLKKTFEILSEQSLTKNSASSVQIHDTPKKIEHLLSRSITLSKKGSVGCAIEAPREKNYQKVMDEGFLDTLVAERQKKGIVLKLLVPQNQLKDIRPQMKNKGITVRALPDALDITSSIWIFEKSVVLFSGNGTLAVEITQANIHNSMQSMFDHFWSDALVT